MILVSFQVVAEEEHLLVIQTEGPLPGLWPEVVLRHRAEDKFVGRSGQPAGNPMAMAANVFPDVERGVDQRYRRHGVHLGIGQSYVTSHLPQNGGMAGADLIVHHQFLPNLADSFSHYLWVMAPAHPGRAQDRTQQTVT